MRTASVLSAVLLLAATSNAWPWPPAVWQPAVNVAKRQIAPLVARQDSTATTSSENTAKSTQETTSATTTADTSSNSDTPTTIDASSTETSGTGTDKSSETSTITGSAKSSGTDSSDESNTAASKTSYSANLPAGGISMITPDAYSTSYYKIGQPITFAWNYTSLSATPTAVDVLAVATANSGTYTIAVNQTIPTGTQTVIWDTGAYESSAGVELPMATYTLIVYDAELSVSATAAAGYLGTSDTFTFGMYQPQQYTPSEVEYQCITCSNDAMARMQKMTLGFVFGMAAMTVFSFTWFAGVAGIL